MDWMGLLGLLGSVAITIALVVLGLLSKRLGSVTRTPPYYLWLFVAAGLMTISTLARLVNLGLGTMAAAGVDDDLGLVLFYVGLPAVAITLGIVVVWRYWSWLLAEGGSSSGEAGRIR